MPSSSNINTSGVTTSNANINSTVVGAGVTPPFNTSKSRFKARVTAIDLTNGNIYYETNGQKLGKSDLGTPNLNNKARPLNIYNIQLPIVGEYVEIISAAEALGLSADKNVAKLIPYYSNILNSWDNINGNKVLDQTVPNQKSNNQMSEISQQNINKSFLMGGI